MKHTKRRKDIQGLRAILMIQVLLFHAWSVGSPIGVDAFIMVSAYLMTGSFVRRAEAGRMPAVLERWANTFKRLLPPLAVVVVVTLLASIAVLPANRWGSLVTQSYASLTYWQNWLLEHVSADYFADNHALSSPLQHLWSMSMQGQVFLLWPVVMAFLVTVARTWKLPLRKTVFWGFAAITAVSLLWLVTVDTPPEGIYFDTRARIWEFALGSAIAAIAPKLRFQRPTERLLANVALVIIVVYSLVSIGSYPGPMAAVPLLATSAILLYSRDDPAGVGRFLGWRPLVGLGDMSYAVYLVHWPVFVLYLAAREKERLSVPEGLVLIALSLVLAFLLTKYVDDPARTTPWASTTGRKTFIAGMALWLGLTFVMTVQNGVAGEAMAAERRAADAAEEVAAAQSGDGSSSPQSGEDQSGEAATEEPEEEEVLPVMEGFPGAAAMTYGGEFSFSAEPIPDPFSLDGEWVMYEGGCSDVARDYLFQYPKTGCHGHGNPEEAAGRILVAGSSHAEQVLMPAARLFADQNNLYVEASLKTGCPWSMPDPGEPSDCGGHNLNVLRYVQEHPPEYVFLIVTATATDSGEERLGYDVETLIRELTATGTTVIGFRDNLRSGTNLYECATGQEPHDAYGGCLLERDNFYGPDSLLDPLLDIPGFYYVDIMDLYCSGGVCPTIAGNVHVYLDTNHITQSYGNTMAPIIAERIDEALADEE